MLAQHWVEMIFAAWAQPLPKSPLMSASERAQKVLEFPAPQARAPTACAQMMLVGRARSAWKPPTPAMPAAPVALWIPSCSPLLPCFPSQNQSTLHSLPQEEPRACERASERQGWQQRSAQPPPA